MEFVSLTINRYIVLSNSIRKIFNVSKRTAVDLAYKIHGDSKLSNNAPIIVIHGLLGSKRNWESICKKIVSSTNKSVIAVDVRNHGESPSHSSHTYPDLASDILSLMNKLSLSKSNFIGHSMGGRTAMVFALTEPTKVASLLVVDISPVSTAGLLNDFFPKLLDVMKTVDFKSVENLAKARALAQNAIMASGLIEHAESTHFILMNIGKRADNSIGWMCNIEALKQYFTAIASFPSEMAGKTYIGPTLFVGGGNSDYLPPEDLPGIRKLFPKAEMVHIPNIGHNVHVEDPVAFLDIVTIFLK